MKNLLGNKNIPFQSGPVYNKETCYPYLLYYPHFHLALLYLFVFLQFTAAILCSVETISLPWLLLTN